MITVIVTKQEAWEVAEFANTENHTLARNLTREARRVIDALSQSDRTRIEFSRVDSKYYATLYARHDSRDIRIMDVRPRVARHWAEDKGIFPKGAPCQVHNAAWKPADDQKLIDMIHSGLRWPEIAPKFTERSENSLHDRAMVLKKQGRLKWYPKNSRGMNAPQVVHKMCGNCKSFKVDTKRTQTDRFLCKVLMGTCSTTGERRDRCDWCNAKNRRGQT
ncbi:MAG: SANT/Myb-like DNA-binding domain-containing protein [Kiritimatiellales bacterium]